MTRNIQELKVGQVAYTPWCDAAGKVLDDGTIARLDETTFRMTAAEPNLRWLEDNARRPRRGGRGRLRIHRRAFAAGTGVARDPR